MVSAMAIIVAVAANINPPARINIATKIGSIKVPAPHLIKVVVGMSLNQKNNKNNIC